MNGNCFKFNLGDKVRLRDKDVVISGCYLTVTPSERTVSYDVSYEREHFVNEWRNGHLMRYMGNPIVTIRVLESDLESVDQYYPKGIFKFVSDDLSQEDVDKFRKAWDTSKLDTTFAVPNEFKINEISIPTVYADDAIDALRYAMGNNTIDNTGTDFDQDKMVFETTWPMIEKTKQVNILYNSMLNPCCEIPLSDISSVSCDHKWLSYEGLTQKFDYCEKCDIKRNQ